MPLIVVALGWLTAVILGICSVVTALAAARGSVDNPHWSKAAAATAAAEGFAAAGVLAVATLSVLAGVLAAACGVTAGILLLTGSGIVWPVEAVRDALRRGPADDLAPRRERRQELAAPVPVERNGPGRRRTAPPPLLPAADDGPAPARPRFAPAAASIPPDHAAAQRRIAEFEPEGLAAFRDFLVREARGFAGYGEPFTAFADGLIHGPGVPPAALRTVFELADSFHDVAGHLNLAVKRFMDYFAGHLEWTEDHDPTKDGHWTIRE